MTTQTLHGPQRGQERQSPHKRLGLALGLNLGLSLGLSAALAMVGVAPQAHAQLFADDDARRAILDLRARNAELTSRVESMSRGQLELLTQVESLRNELATLRGQLEQNQQSSLQIKDQLSQAEAQLQAVGPQPITVDGEGFSVGAEEKRLFEVAMASMDARELKAAADGFRQFQQRFPGSPLEPAAMQREGSLRFALNDNRRAREVLQALAARHPKAPQRPNAMLTLATIQAAEGQTANARKTLEAVRKDHPGTEAAKTAAQRLNELGKR